MLLRRLHRAVAFRQSVASSCRRALIGRMFSGFPPSNAVGNTPPRPGKDVAPSNESDSAPAIPYPPPEATAGLSADYKAEFLERAAKGRTLPIIWNNPGAYSQLDRVPAEVLYALPPPRRPLWPMKPSELTWRYARSFSIALLFVALALYLQAKERVKGSVRLALERRAPWFTDFLVSLQAIRDYRQILADFNRQLLFERLFFKFTTVATAFGASSPETIPVSRAVAILHVMRGIALPPGLVSGSSAEGGSAALPLVLDGTDHSALVAAVGADAAAAVGAATAAGGGGSGSSGGGPVTALSLPQFCAFLAAGAAAVPDAVLFLACGEALGVAPVSRAVHEALEELHARVVASRGGSGSGGGRFSAAALAALSSDIGFTSDASVAARWWADAVVVAAATDAAATPAGGNSSSDVAAPQEAAAAVVQLTCAQFVDFMAAAAAEAQIDDSRIADYLRVFYMLHLSGIREEAGVRSVAAA